MSVAYIVVDKDYQSLADALEEIHDQLIVGEDIFSEEQLRVVDEAAPGPDPLVVPPRTDPLATVVKSTGPALKANKNIAAAKENKFITFEEPKKGAGHFTPSARIQRHKPLVALNTNLRSVSLADSRLIKDTAELESEDAEDSDSDSSDWSDYTNHHSSDNSGEEYTSDGSSEEHRDSHTDDDTEDDSGDQQTQHASTSVAVGVGEAQVVSTGAGPDDKNVVGSGKIIYTYSIDWANPPKWGDKTIPEMPPNRILCWFDTILNDQGMSRSKVTKCELNACNVLLRPGGLKNHLASKTHFNLRRQCLRCGFSSRFDVFIKRHECDKRLKKKRRKTEKDAAELATESTAATVKGPARPM